MAMGIWLPGGGGGDFDAITAGAGDVLAGKVILDSEGEPLKGTMPERGNWSSSELSAGASITIPGGHHSGSGKVTAKSLSAQTSGTATAAQILSGKTAWVNGSEVTGSMANRGNYGGTGNSRGNDTSGQRMWVKVPGGYYNENAQVFLNWADIRSMAGLTPDKIKKNVSIMGITGTHDGFVPGPMDIYNRGSWGAGYSTSDVAVYHSSGDNTTQSNDQYYSASLTAESSAIKCQYNATQQHPGGAFQRNGYFRIRKNINFTPYSKLNFLVSKVFGHHAPSNYAADFKDVAIQVAILSTSNTIISISDYYNGGKVQDLSDPSGEVTGSINLSGVNVIGQVSIELFHKRSRTDRGDVNPYTCYVHKIWFS